MTDAIQLDIFYSQSPKEPINLRKHQDEFYQICKRIKAGEQIKKILMLVTPGGGKSLIPVIAAAQLIPNYNSGNSFHGTIADAICWVVPISEVCLGLNNHGQGLPESIEKLAF